jgi:hypothetical protein
MAADMLGKHLTEDFRRLFGSSRLDEAERLGEAARIALECLGKSDALYHNVEHTFLVTLVGRDILHGRILTERLEPEDYSHLIVACLVHDLGYVRGILKGDGDGRYVINDRGDTVTLERGRRMRRSRSITSTARRSSSGSAFSTRPSSIWNGWHGRSSSPASPRARRTTALPRTGRGASSRRPT